ncbi:hypothetical protein GGX14DRAFT_481046 [Mycena pura]|uniref:Uncharacterized protein n=1 Tax=Mycena pura TaxID=153505 RepID=A0AAD6Y114_9AGAR|nr:hypothetical protein GGX14DRAFT_481046 [Mycena pura]
MSEKIKSNKRECEHLAERSAQIVQDIWRQTKDFNVVLPAEVERSVVEIETLFRKIENFFNRLDKEKVWQRLARQDRHKSQVEEYGRLFKLDEAISQISINLQFGVHRLHVEFAAADEKRHVESAAAARQEHADVLAVSQMSEAERLVPSVQVASMSDTNLGDVRMGKLAALGIAFFL